MPDRPAKTTPTLRSPHAAGLERYLADLAAIAPLSPEEEEALLATAAEGCAAARERIVLAHLPQVVRIAYRYGGYGLPLADLISEGNIGLLRAAELFDPTHGVPFTAYASVWIKQRMHRAITAQARVVRIPVWRSQRLRKLDRLHADLDAELGRDTDLAELAERIGIPQDDLTRMSQEALQIDSLDDPATPSPTAAMREGATPADRLLQQERDSEIAACLQGLDETEFQILTRRFGLIPGQPPQSYRAMSGDFGKSREWIRKIGEGALQKLRASFQSAGDLPQLLREARQQRFYSRIKRLARHKNLSIAPDSLSLLPMVLTHYMEKVHLPLCF